MILFFPTAITIATIESGGLIPLFIVSAFCSFPHSVCAIDFFICYGVAFSIQFSELFLRVVWESGEWRVSGFLSLVATVQPLIGADL